MLPFRFLHEFGGHKSDQPGNTNDSEKQPVIPCAHRGHDKAYDCRQPGNGF